MKRIIPASLLMLSCTITPLLAAEQPPTSGKDLGNVQGGDFNKAHGIISQKCTVCHTREKIDLALSSGKDMTRIQKEMEKKGAKLNANERDVLGIYWKRATPLK